MGVEARVVVELVAATEPEAVVEALEVVLELVSEWDAASSICPSFASLSRLRAKFFFWLILVSSP